ncbi:30S ribosomal protein S4 [bacterium]|nr:30S ribosomal protein S4 [bacterium]MCP5463270.1 30S ribosomal protein S4 [bacterium]
MARYTGPVCKLCRREGEKLFLKGYRCYTPKCCMERRNFAPGMHGKRRTKLSSYGEQLREKQKLKRTYGMLEKSFRLLFERANRQQGITGENLLRLLELRLDNVVYRSGFQPGRIPARMYVSHGHVSVNGRTVDIPSYTLRTGDVVVIRDKEKSRKAASESLKLTESRIIPSWLSVDKDAFKAVIEKLPERDEIDTPVNEQLIVELYSK